jgi:hypothetical protein
MQEANRNGQQLCSLIFRTVATLCCDIIHECCGFELGEVREVPPCRSTTFWESLAKGLTHRH